MPRPRLEPAPRLPSVPWWAAAITLVWLAGVGVTTALGRAVGDAPALCMFRRTTGVPCPTCGTTRAALAVLRGRPLEALTLNPLVSLTVLVLVVGLALRVASGRRLAIHPAAPWRRLAWCGALVLLVANWVYVIQSSG